MIHGCPTLIISIIHRFCKEFKEIQLFPIFPTLAPGYELDYNLYKHF